VRVVKRLCIKHYLVSNNTENLNMRKIYCLLIIVSICYSCKTRTDFNNELASELKKMAEIDQIAAYIPQGQYLKLSPKQWNKFRDSVFTDNKTRLKIIFKEFGYPGFDLVGKTGELDFWLIVQHCDNEPEFQKLVLKELKKQVDKKNADPYNFCFLTDRVNINLGKKQIYGTQVTYNSLEQAIPINLYDSANVNLRRAKIGIESLEVYLNKLTSMHFDMNKQILIESGIKEPNLYKIKM
jgi:hypothetical protein